MPPGTSWEEENWHAQYGQVIHSGEETIPDFQTIDLWDWAMVRGTRKDGKNPVARLVGRLMRQSARLHPSMPLGGGILKTAPISEVHLDLVRVTSGSLYPSFIWKKERKKRDKVVSLFDVILYLTMQHFLLSKKTAKRNDIYQLWRPYFMFELCFLLYMHYSYLSLAATEQIH